jgi:hypothetical protein
MEVRVAPDRKERFQQRYPAAIELSKGRAKKTRA